MTQVWQVQVAAPSKGVATALARAAVEARLAAGGQVHGPVTSVFWHIGEFGTGEEWQVVLKTTEGLTAHGQQVMRNAITPAGQPYELRTDLFNITTRELIEAKGTATRNAVRLALGQLLDYRRGVPHERLAVLLPVRPAEDLVELLTTLGISCVYELADGEFEREEP